MTSLRQMLLPIIFQFASVSSSYLIPCFLLHFPYPPLPNPSSDDLDNYWWHDHHIVIIFTMEFQSFLPTMFALA